MPEDATATVRQIVTFALKALGAAGVPGASLAADMVDAAAAWLDQRRAWDDLRAALQWAEARFWDEALARGWQALADAILQLPVHDLPTFEAAVRAALEGGNAAPLEERLRAALADLPGVEPALAAQAARLYAALVLDALWVLPAFRDAVRDVLFREQVARLRRVETLLTRLGRWWRLTPALQRQPREALLREGHITLTALKAPLALVPFVGREHARLRDELAAWALGLAESRYRADLRLLVGPGGAGKTRTAVEIARTLMPYGWEAFFLPEKDLRGAVTNPDALRSEARVWFLPQRPTLYILDYAETLPETVIETLLDVLYETASERHAAVALLWLQRRAPAEGLKNALTAPTGSDVGRGVFRREVVEPGLSQPHRVPRLAREDLPKLFQKARAVFLDLLGREPAETVEYAAEDLPDRPLAVVLLALLAAYGRRVESPAADEAGIQQIFSAVWTWEQDKARRVLEAAFPDWPPRRRARGLERIEQARVAATLGRIFHAPEEVVAFWRGLGRRDGLREEDLFDLAEELPRLAPPGPDEKGLVAAIAPDPLADWVLGRRADLDRILRAMLPSEGEIQQALRSLQEPVEQLDSDHPVRKTLTLVARVLALIERLAGYQADSPPQRAASKLSQALFQYMRDTSQVLPAPARELWLDLWDELLPENPERTLHLREVWTHYAKARLALARDKKERAGWLNDLGGALATQGRRAEAQAATQEAVDLYRDLAAQNSAAFSPYLAIALNNLGNRLSALGQREEALAATQEAVYLYRNLAVQNPAAFHPHLAASLSNLGNHLNALGRHQEALAATQEAVDIYRSLAAQNPHAFHPGLAKALNNLGRDLAALGHYEEALTAAQEAVDLYRDLADQNPQAFRPYLAMALNNLSNILNALGWREEALAAAQEAVDLYRDLADQNPQAFRPGLAMALVNLGARLNALGRREEALAATQEAVDIYRDLAAQNPAAFRSNLAMALVNLGAVLSALGRRREALAATQEAVDIYRDLTAQNPAAFHPDLARALANLGAILSALNRPKEALAATQEAVDLYRDLAVQNPQAFHPDLARSLGAHGDALLQTGQPRAAVDAFREGLEILLPFANALPQVFGELLTWLLQQYLRACQAAGCPPDEDLVREAEAIRGE